MPRIASNASFSVKSYGHTSYLPLFTYNQTISTDYGDFDLYNEIITNGAGFKPGMILNATITINSGASVGRAVDGNLRLGSIGAFQISDLNCAPGSVLNLIVNGRIVGAGGNGARGTTINYVNSDRSFNYTLYSAGSGYAGLYVNDVNLIINISGSGYIAGGGGGGGPGTYTYGYTSGSNDSFFVVAGNGGGAGSGGRPWPSNYSGDFGGIRGLAGTTSGVVSPYTGFSGVDGNNSTPEAPGSGGPSQNVNGATNGNGGNGGDRGTAGSNGGSGQSYNVLGNPSIPAITGRAGAAGKSISCLGRTSNITYSGSFPTNLYGSVA